MTLALADELVLSLADPDRQTVIDRCTTLVRGGLSLASLVDEGLAPAMREVGSLWEGGAWTVLDEHLATAVAEAGLSAAAAEVGPSSGERGDVVIGCVEGDWHSLPVRMVSEVLAAEGWSVRFLGASQPTRALVSYVERHQPQAVLLSCAVPMPLPALAAAVQALHAVGVPVYAGGRAVDSADRAQAIGADGWASTAAATVELLANAPHAAPRDVTAALSSWESRRRTMSTWVEDASTVLRRLMPEMSSYTQDQHDHTAYDMHHLALTASTSVLLGERRLLSDQCTWLARLLISRGVSDRALGYGLEALQETRPECPDAEELGSVLTAASMTIAA